MSQSEEEDSDNDQEKCSLVKKYSTKKGVVPKDMDAMKEYMSFVAYGHHLENTCKMASCNKQFYLNDGDDKNRLYCTGQTMMSAKLSVNMANSRKLCEDLQNEYIFNNRVKREFFLEKQPRNQTVNKMKQILANVAELTSKYVELSDFKKYSCLSIEQAVPKIK